jgi:hypothetical protein
VQVASDPEAYTMPVNKSNVGSIAGNITRASFVASHKLS